MSIKTDRPTDRAGSVELYDLLSGPMPAEALSNEGSRGFTLTSIKAGFVIERLNQTLGLLGYGWRYAHGPHRTEGDEVLVPVAVQWRVVEEPEEGARSYPVYWNQWVDTHGVVREGWYLDKDSPPVWSEPVFATGGSSLNRKGSLKVTDAVRGAVTNGITKAASRLGVGIEIWKGENDAPGNNGATGRKQAPKRTERAKAAPKRNDGPRHGSLEAMQEAAQAEFDRLSKVEDGLAQAKDVQPLAHKMQQLGIRMQPVKLLYILLGKGDTTMRRVMACFNFIQQGLPEDDVEILCHAAAQAKLPLANSP